MDCMILVVLFVSIFVFFLHPFEGSGDFFHEVNLGKLITQTGHLPYFDTWTHTANGLPWVAHSWGSGIIFYELIKNLGPYSIVFLTSLMAATTFLLLYILLRLYKISKISSFLTIGVIVPLFASRFPQRPEMFEYIFILLILIIDELKKKNYKYSFFMPLIILVWANVYGSSVLFGVLLTGYLAFKEVVFIDKFKFAKVKLNFYLATILSLPISLINGYGFKTLFYIFYYIPTVRTYEGEWAGITKLISSEPPSQLVFTQYFILIYLLFLVLFVILSILSYKEIRKNIYLSLFGLSIFAPIFVFRNLPLAAILTAPILAIFISHELIKKRKTIIGLSLIFIIFEFGITLWINTPKLSADKNIPMEEMINFIQKNNIKGNALNTNVIGAYLTYRLYPNVLVFFDTRDELFVNTPALTDLYSAYNNDLSVSSLLTKYKIDLVVGDYLSDGLNYKDLFYSSNWSLVYFNERYFVFVPTLTAKEENIATLPFLDLYSPSGAKAGHEKEATLYFKNLTEKFPGTLNNSLLLSSAYFSLGDFNKVIEINKSLKIDFTSPVGALMEHDRATLLADAYLENKDCSNAKIYLDKSLQPVLPVLIFTPRVGEVDAPYKQLAKYAVICEKDKTKGSEYLNKYLNSNSDNPLLKIKFQREYDNLIR